MSNIFGPVDPFGNDPLIQNWENYMAASREMEPQETTDNPSRSLRVDGDNLLSRLGRRVMSWLDRPNGLSNTEATEWAKSINERKARQTGAIVVASLLLYAGLTSYFVKAEFEDDDQGAPPVETVLDLDKT